MPKKKPGKNPKHLRPPVPPTFGNEFGDYPEQLAPFGAPPMEQFPPHLGGPGRFGPAHGRAHHHRPPHHRRGGHPGFGTMGPGGTFDQLSYRVQNCLVPFTSVEQATFCARITMYDMPPEAIGKTLLGVTSLETAISIAGDEVVGHIGAVDMTWVTHGYGPAPMTTPLQTHFVETGQTWETPDWLSLLAYGPHHQRLISLLMLLTQELMSRAHTPTNTVETGDPNAASSPEA